MFQSRRGFSEKKKTKIDLRFRPSPPPQTPAIHGSFGARNSYTLTGGPKSGLAPKKQVQFQTYFFLKDCISIQMFWSLYLCSNLVFNVVFRARLKLNTVKGAIQWDRDIKIGGVFYGGSWKYVRKGKIIVASKHLFSVFDFCPPPS